MATPLCRSGRIQDQQQNVQPAHTSASNTETMPIKQKPNNAFKRHKAEEKPSIEVSGDACVPVEISETATEGPHFARPDKRVRGRRGLLKFMTDIPLDTLYEIFRELEPVDLLHLSWSSKSLNSIIMERNARFIWEKAFERLYESGNPPPRCPDDINLAQYARFLFEKNCMICWDVHGYYTSWVLRLRACWKCLYGSGRFEVVGYSERDYCLTISAKKRDFCFDEGQPDWLEYVESISLPTLRGEREKLGTLRRKDMNQFTTWEASRSQDRLVEHQQLQSQRRDEILSKLAELGWSTPQIEKIAGDSIGKLPGFRRAKKLGNREWQRLQPKLLERLEELFNKKRKRKLRERWEAFENRFTEWCHAQAIEPYWKPSAIDIATLDPFRSIIFKPSLENAVFEIDEIDLAARTWMGSRNKFLISLLPQDVQASVVTVVGEDNDVRLLPPHLACLLFKKPEGCHPSSCYTPITTADFYTLSDICQHRHRFQHGSSESEDNEIYRAIESFSSCRPWDWDCRTLGLKFDEKAYLIAKNVLQEVFGLNPLETTVAQMRERTVWFKCTQCPRNSYCFGTNQGWLQIISHEMRYEGDLPIATRWTTKHS